MSEGGRNIWYLLALVVLCLAGASGLAFWAFDTREATPPDAAMEPEPEALPLVVIPVKRPFEFCTHPAAPDPEIEVTEKLRRQTLTDMNARAGFRYLSGQVHSGRDGRPTLYASHAKQLLVISAPGAFHELPVADVAAALAAYHEVLTERGFEPAGAGPSLQAPELAQTLPTDQCPRQILSETEHAVLHHTATHEAYRMLAGHSSTRTAHPTIYAEHARLRVVGRDSDESYPMLLLPRAFRSFSALLSPDAPTRPDGGGDGTAGDATPARL